MEQWKDIPGYEGLYQIKWNGKIKALQKEWITGRGKGRPHIQKEKILKPFVSKFGYKRIALSKDGKYKKFHIHQLVALCFVDGYFEGAIVNHKDGNKLNNYYKNLEWVTQSENQKHAFRIGLKYVSEHTKAALSKRHTGGRNVNAKKVVDIWTGKVFETIKDAATHHNLKPHNLYSYLKGRNPNPTSLRYA